MMTSRYAVPAAGSLHVGGGRSSISCPAIHSPQMTSSGRGPGKILVLLGANDRAESDKDCAQILCVYICNEWGRACPIDVRRACCFIETATLFFIGPALRQM
jgi:hypothetical protein